MSVGGRYGRIARAFIDRVAAVEGPLPSVVGASLAQVVGASLAQAAAVLALADEQHTRNRLAAITAAHRGITLPPDLHALTEEGLLP